MPDLSSLISPLAAARFAVAAYAALATVLTTACLTLHAIAACERRLTHRTHRTAGTHGTNDTHLALAGRTPRSATRRPLFVPLEAAQES